MDGRAQNRESEKEGELYSIVGLQRRGPLPQADKRSLNKWETYLQRIKS